MYWETYCLRSHKLNGKFLDNLFCVSLTHVGLHLHITNAVHPKSNNL